MAGIVTIVSGLFTIMNLLILVRILLSWLPMAGIRIDPYNPVVRFLIETTDIVLEPFRRVIPPISGMDFSPIVAIIVLSLVEQLVVSLLLNAV